MIGLLRNEALGMCLSQVTRFIGAALGKENGFSVALMWFGYCAVRVGGSRGKSWPSSLWFSPPGAPAGKREKMVFWGPTRGGGRGAPRLPALPLAIVFRADGALGFGPPSRLLRRSKAAGPGCGGRKIAGYGRRFADKQRLIPAAALRASRTLSRTVKGPRTMSPPAKTRGIEVC